MKIDSAARIGIRLPVDTRADIHAAAEECDRSESYMVRQFIDVGIHARDAQRLTAIERYARVADYPAITVPQHAIQRAALYLASCDGEANIEALALVRGAYGASLDEAREILHSMLVRTGFVAPDARPERRGAPDVEM